VEGEPALSPAFLLSLLLCAGVALLLADARRGAASARRLRDVPPLDPAALPPVTIVVAARDEERHIAAAARSLLAQDYPDYDVVVVNDRSTDRTGAILAGLAAGDSRLRVVTVRELPDGWLGKNHAMHAGARHARGRYVLFTDGDVILHPSALRRAVSACEREGIDHLAVGPDVVTPTLPLRFAVVGFTAFFILGMRAFNLVRRRALRAIGGFRRIRLRPDDDIKLGKVLKRLGWRQDLFSGQEMVSVEWYPTLRAMVHGLEKNSFSAFDYSLPRTLASLAGLLGVFVWPFVGVFVTGGATRVLLGLTAAMLAVMAAGGARRIGRSPLNGLLLPLQACLLAAIIVNATVKTLWRGGIEWRGTRYPLAQLRRNIV
jgi:hypothetical protein